MYRKVPGFVSVGSSAGGASTAGVACSSSGSVLGVSSAVLA